MAAGYPPGPLPITITSYAISKIIYEFLIGCKNTPKKAKEKTK